MTPEVFKRKALESLQSFDPGLVIRGVQLTFVGAYRALQNPTLFRTEHYKQAAVAVLAGIVLKVLIDLPILAVKLLLYVSGAFIDLRTSNWDHKVVLGVEFIEKNVLQIPLFLMTYFSWHLTNSLDSMFMESLAWVDQTYSRKHANESDIQSQASFHENLILWGKTSDKRADASVKVKRRNAFIDRAMKKGAVSLAVYFGSLVPALGKLVLPTVSAYSIHGPAGIGPSIVVFIATLFVPRQYMIMALQAYYASRSLTRQLLEPYFSRIKFTEVEKKRWFRERQGVLFGFGIGFYILLRIPLLGILMYGIAEASTAYLITKITDPPPHPSKGAKFAASQAEWERKDEFIKISAKKIGPLASKIY